MREACAATRRCARSGVAARKPESRGAARSLRARDAAFGEADAADRHGGSASIESSRCIGAGGMGEVYRARDTKLGSRRRDQDPAARASRAIPIGWRGSNARRACSRHSIIRTSARSMDSKTLTACGRWCSNWSRARRWPTESRADRLPVERRADHRAADCGRARRGARERDRPPRSEAGQYQDHADGVVKVLDFGLAKAASGDAATADLTQSPTMTVGGTREGVILGTAAYMSPEQARGQTVDKRTDIWAFGCVLYEMLTGRAAFARDTLTDTLAAVVEGRPNWSLLSATPRPITRLIQRCLETDVRRRLRDIADARIELDDALSGAPAPEPVSALESRRRPSALAADYRGRDRRGWNQRRRSPRSRSPGLRPYRLPEERLRGLIATQLTNYDGTESGGALSPDGRSFVFVSNHGGTPDIYLRQVSGGEPVRLTNDAAEEALPAFAPDGDTIYFTRIDEAGTGIWRTGALGGQPRKVLDNALTPAPSPDGKRLAYVTRGKDGFTLGVMALDGSGARTLVERIRTGTFRPAWSPDGRWLTYSNWALFGPVDVFVVDAATGQQRRCGAASVSGRQ